MCVRVGESSTPHVNYEAKVVQKVCAQDGLLDIGYNEDPPEGTTQAYVESAGPHAEGRNSRTVYSLQ